MIGKRYLSRTQPGAIESLGYFVIGSIGERVVRIAATDDQRGGLLPDFLEQRHVRDATRRRVETDDGNNNIWFVYKQQSRSLITAPVTAQRGPFTIVRAWCVIYTTVTQSLESISNLEYLHIVHFHSNSAALSASATAAAVPLQIPIALCQNVTFVKFIWRRVDVLL